MRGFFLLAILVFSALIGPQGSASALLCKLQQPGPKLRYGRWPEDLFKRDPYVKVFASQDVLLRVVQHKTYQILGIAGVVYIEDWPLISKALDALVPGKNVVVFTLFGGGTTGPIRGLIDGIRSKCPKELGCHVRTEVTDGDSCVSNCVSVFLMGEQRIARERSQFGFHAASADGQLRPGVVEGVYKQMGMNRDWLVTHKEFFETTKVTLLGPAQLAGSNLVTHVLPSAPRPQVRAASSLPSIQLPPCPAGS